MVLGARLKLHQLACTVVVVLQLFVHGSRVAADTPLFDAPPLVSGPAPVVAPPPPQPEPPPEPITPLPDDEDSDEEPGEPPNEEHPEAERVATQEPSESPSAQTSELPAPASTSEPPQQDANAEQTTTEPGVAEQGEAVKADPPADNKPGENGEKKERLGEEPPNSAIDIFRQSNVLLPVGVIECEYGFQYTMFEDSFLTIFPDASIAPERTTSRTMLGSASVRYGYSERFQPYITVPGGMTTVEVANSLDDDSNDQYGIGDVTFGASYLLRDGKDECADVVFGLTFVAPTGESNFLSIVPGNASLGNGFWIVSPSLSWTRTFDPVVLYATAAYLHRFEREHFGIPIRPGEEFDIGYGAGFAINDELTYSLQFQWAHQFDTVVNHQSIDDSGADIATIRQSAIIRITPQKFVEVFFANGLTKNSPEVSMGLLYVRRY